MINNDNIEFWTDIPGREGTHQISNFGRVKTLSRQIHRNNRHPILKERILKQSGFKNDYQRCGLGYIHRLMGLTFIPNPENKPQINHKNGVKDDNRIENLEWCTNGENVKHGWDAGYRQCTEKQRSAARDCMIAWNTRDRRLVND